MDAPGNRADLISRFRDGPALLEAAVCALTDAELDAVPPRGDWSVRQIVHHVADGDDLWRLAIKMAMGTEGAEFSLAWYHVQPQEAWAERWAYRTRPIGPSLALLRTGREHVLQLLEQVPDAWHRAVLFRNRDGSTERVPVGCVIGMQADHLLHHLERVREILARRDADRAEPSSAEPGQ